MNTDLDIKSAVEMTDEEIEAFRKAYGIKPYQVENKNKTKVVKTEIKTNGIRTWRVVTFLCDWCGKESKRTGSCFSQFYYHYCQDKCKVKAKNEEKRLKRLKKK